MFRKKNRKLTNLPQQAAQVPTTDARETPETPGARDDDPTHSRIPHVLNLLMPSFTPPLMHLTPFSIFISTPLQHSAGEQKSLGKTAPLPGAARLRISCFSCSYRLMLRVSLLEASTQHWWFRVFLSFLGGDSVPP
jgi:hypothetical protein